MDLTLVSISLSCFKEDTCGCVNVVCVCGGTHMNLPFNTCNRKTRIHSD